MKASCRLVSLAGMLLFFTACNGAQYHAQQVTAATDGTLTAGTVQREIRVGMPGSEVIAVLGAPNIVTLDETRREVWVYDRIATQHVYSADSGGIASLIFGGGAIGDGGLGGGLAPSYSKSAGASSTTQRTFTVLIKFDEQKRVRDFSYRSSSF